MIVGPKNKTPVLKHNVCTTLTRKQYSLNAVASCRDDSAINNMADQKRKNNPPRKQYYSAIFGGSEGGPKKVKGSQMRRICRYQKKENTTVPEPMLSTASLHPT